MREGKLFWWNCEKGFGVIVSKGERFYLHVLKLSVENTRLPEVGDLIRFTPSDVPPRNGRLVEAIDAEIVLTPAQAALAGKATESEVL